MCSINDKYYKEEAPIYIREVKIERDGERYGVYYQAVRSYRERKKGVSRVKQDVVHLGEHETAESALDAWPGEIEELKRIGRPKAAERLRAKLAALQEMVRKSERGRS